MDLPVIKLPSEYRAIRSDFNGKMRLAVEGPKDREQCQRRRESLGSYPVRSSTTWS